MRSRCLACSAEAIIVSWLLTGIGFCLLVRGPGVISAWLIWGTFVYLAA